MNNIIIKRSNLGKLNYPQLDNYTIKRAMTIKEAMNKQSKEQYDCIIIEAAQTADVQNISSIIATGVSLNANTIVVLLTEPNTEIDVEELTQLRTLVNNTRQVVIIEKYAEENKYEDIIEQIALLYENMTITSSTKNQENIETKSTDLNLAEELRFEELQTDTQELIDLKYKLASTAEELRIAKSFIDKMVNTPVVTELTIGGAEASRLYEENDALKQEIDKLKNIETSLSDYELQIKDLNTTVEAEQQVTEMLRTLIKKIYDYDKIMKKENLKYEAQTVEAESKAKDLTIQVNDLTLTNTDLTNQINNLALANADLRDKNDELTLDLNNTIAIDKQLREKISSLDDIITNLTNDKRNLSLELNKANAEVAKLSTYDVELLKKQATDSGNVQDILEMRLRQAKEETKNFDLKNKSLIKELNNARIKIEKLTSENRALELLLDGENYGTTGLIWNKRVQARMLAFVGHGGQGCSSMITGVARRLYELGKNVVVIDCDFRAPKLHAIFGVNPIIDYTQFPSLSNTELKTSLAKLLAIKEQVYTNMEKELIIDVAANKKARLDMLSGLIAARSNSEIGGLDLNTLCVELSAKYDYILVDLGRSEGTGGIARQQAVVMQNANRRFVVTNNNLECVKSVITRLIQAHINVDSIEVIFNLVHDKNNKSLETIISRVKRIYSMPFDRAMSGRVCETKSNSIVVKQIVATELGDAANQ